jgi:FkbM family methyltransferase
MPEPIPLPQLTVEQYEQINPVATIAYGDTKLQYAVPNSTTLWRVKSLLTKEPCTIEWLNAIAADEVLLDVGANVGMYTIFAAVVRGARVYAFEPESQNYALLCRNIVMNNLAKRVTAWPCALSDENKFDRIYLSQFTIGGSCHAFGDNRDFQLNRVDFPFIQGSIATTIDKLIADYVMPAPNHIKIDVDGFEHKVIAGGASILKNPALKSLIIEINPALPEHQGMIAQLKQVGFVYDPQQVARATRTEGAFEGVGEYVFRR